MSCAAIEAFHADYAMALPRGCSRCALSVNWLAKFGLLSHFELNCRRI